MRRAWALGAVLGMGAVTMLVAGVAIADSGPPPVSGADPYAACTAGAPGFNFPSTEVEPFVAVNPANSNNIVGVFQQDRWDNGGARGIAAAVTFDGGQIWSIVTLPFSTCASGGINYPRASDPWISFGPDGTAYASGISVDLRSGRSAVAVAVSHDGGSTWGDVHRVKIDRDHRILNDKESVTADPVHPGVAYVIWDRVDARRRNNQPTYFSRTKDFGKTWSKPRRITSNARGRGSIGEVVVVDPRNDTLYDVYSTLPSDGFEGEFSNVSVMVSHNQGASWSRPVVISHAWDVTPKAPTGAFLRPGEFLPDAAIDPKTGRLYVVWDDARFSRGRYDEVALSTSKNGGRKWSKPIRVSKKSGGPAVTPMVAVNTAGVVGVSYYDFRTLPTSDPSTLPTSYWLAMSPRGGKSFKSEKPIIETPFDLLSAPFAEGYFLGDYQGLATAGPSFVSFFAQATGTETSGGDPSNRTDVYFNSLLPG